MSSVLPGPHRLAPLLLTVGVNAERGRGRGRGRGVVLLRLAHDPGPVPNQLILGPQRRRVWSRPRRVRLRLSRRGIHGADRLRAAPHPRGLLSRAPHRPPALLCLRRTPHLNDPAGLPPARDGRAHLLFFAFGGSSLVRTPRLAASLFFCLAIACSSLGVVFWLSRVMPSVGKKERTVVL